MDCTEAFLRIAQKERDEAGMPHVRYLLGDAQECELPTEHFDAASSRFGVMFFRSAVRALQNARKSLKPGGKLNLVVWCKRSENPAWNDAREIALKHLPPPGDNAATCGPGSELLRDDRAIDRIWRGLRDRAKHLPGSDTEARTPVAAALSYIRHRKSMMRYASHYAAKLAIGSGATESTCWTMQKRVKRPAQSWECLAFAARLRCAPSWSLDAGTPRGNATPPPIARQSHPLPDQERIHLVPRL